MSFIAFLLIGALAGYLASRFMNKNNGLLMNLFIGIVGAYVGGVLGRTIGIAATGIIGELIVATVGAIILLWVAGKLRG